MFLVLYCIYIHVLLHFIYLHAFLVLYILTCTYFYIHMLLCTYMLLNINYISLVYIYRHTYLLIHMHSYMLTYISTPYLYNATLSFIQNYIFFSNDSLNEIFLITNSRFFRKLTLHDDQNHISYWHICNSSYSNFHISYNLFHIFCTIRFMCFLNVITYFVESVSYISFM